MSISSRIDFAAKFNTHADNYVELHNCSQMTSISHCKTAKDNSHWSGQHENLSALFVQQWIICWNNLVDLHAKLYLAINDTPRRIRQSKIVVLLGCSAVQTNAWQESMLRLRIPCYMLHCLHHSALASSSLRLWVVNIVYCPTDGLIWAFSWKLIVGLSRPNL